MKSRTVTATSADVLDLVQNALTEFDSVSLEATARRTIRIANLMGDTKAAVRLGLELHATTGDPASNRETIERLMADPQLFAANDGPAVAAVDQYLADRKQVGKQDVVLSHSVPEIEFWLAEPRMEHYGASDTEVVDDLQRRLAMTKILARSRHYAFTLLCKWERELSFATRQESALAVVASRVDHVLAQRAPEVLDRFSVAFRRLRDAAERDSEGEAAEELSQAVASCRRILKAVIDIVEPADRSKPASDEGHALTDDAYRNRLVEYLKAHVDSGTFRTAVIDAGKSLFERFKSTDELASKGVHAKVARDEAEFCALHSYLLAGEILLLAE